jgi:hypothetical protein
MDLKSGTKSGNGVFEQLATFFSALATPQLLKRVCPKLF